MTDTTVVIFHNIATDFAGRNLGMVEGYDVGHPLVPVFRCAASDLTESTDSNLICEAAFHVFNVGDDPAMGQVSTAGVTYRRWKNRSLSVGDVVQIGDEFFSCQRQGWKVIPMPKWIVRSASAYGSVAMAERYGLDTPAGFNDNRNDPEVALRITVWSMTVEPADGEGDAIQTFVAAEKSRHYATLRELYATKSALSDDQLIEYLSDRDIYVHFAEHTVEVDTPAGFDNR